MKLRSIETYLNSKYGTLPFGEYYVEGRLKIGHVHWHYNGKHKAIEITLLKEYNKGDTINLKKYKDTLNYIVVYYDKLFHQENKTLVEKYCQKLSNYQLETFWSKHALILQEVLGEEFENLLLKTIFQIGKIPNQFELLYNGNKSIDNPFLYKEEWKHNKKSFKILVYGGK